MADLPPTLKQIAFQFRIAGWISFWMQLVLGVVATLVLIFATASRSIGTQTNSAGTGAGILFALGGIAVLGAGVYWAFRYTRIARGLRSPDASARPSKASTTTILRLGLIINLVGMLITILGAQAIVGSILARSLSQPQGLTVYDPSRFVQSVDLFVVQANTNTILAHFAGIVGSLWLFNRVNR
ncbi:DUF3611 family protein [Geitlerinema sp. PCC 7407]|uniref:DUF3611 family protein n=1 Tax=Geitlerinema sp. PCC 7407 TaxID=1173025 RepID=UPI00029FE3B0|nr:DUF3611 family protein [Geitlerinema sp. PCC 7407]AFY67367.1 hypothetical protein GEI7407_2896 [Geitlerinema sp. PCC 7407]